MPKPEKVMRAVNNSSCNAEVAIATQTPTDNAVWRRVSKFNIPKHLSATPDYYAVTIFGEVYSYTTDTSRQVEIQRVSSTYHPILAVGQAVIRFFNDNARASITGIDILKREIKKN